MKRSQKSGPTAGRRADPQRVKRADLQLGKEHSQLQARKEHSQLQARTSQDKVNYDKENDIAMEIGRNPRLVKRC